MLRDFQMTSFEGGWKAVVIFDADCLDDRGGGNAILKALEEPGQRRLWFLLTAHPDQLLTTIRSRCQRIVLTSGHAEFSGTWVVPLREWLVVPPQPAGIPALAGAAFLKQILDIQKDEIEKRVKAETKDEEIEKEIFDARVRSNVIKVRDEILSYITLWRRDVLACTCGADSSALHFPADETTLRSLAKQLGTADALASLRVMQEISRRFDRNMQELQVFEAALLA
jgi:DNA polymerase-3 subunit delta'